MKIDFIIIGGQKCGSTYLQSVISEHPEIYMPAGECPHFESPDYENGGMDLLRKLFKDANKEVIGIKRPNYFSKPEVPSRIKAELENVKLILILRNPLERLKSAYFHYMKDGFLPILPLNQGIEQLLDNKLQAKYPRTKELLEFGFYSKNLQEYLTLFGRDNMLILFHDDLKKDKISVIKQCFSFLNVATEFMPRESLNKKPQEVNYSLPRVWLLTKKNKYLYTYNQNKTRIFVKPRSKIDKLISRSIDKIDKYIFRRIFKTSEKPKFDPSIKQKLLDIYNTDIQNLEKILSVDLSMWKQ